MTQAELKTVLKLIDFHTTPINVPTCYMDIKHMSAASIGALKMDLIELFGDKGRKEQDNG